MKPGAESERKTEVNVLLESPNACRGENRVVDKEKEDAWDENIFLSAK